MSGDHVMGWSTSVIAPPGGNLNDFMASLRKLAALELRVMYPAHGWSIDDPQARIAELHQHREQRTSQALDALAAGLATIPAMVERIYADVDQPMTWSPLISVPPPPGLPAPPPGRPTSSSR